MDSHIVINYALLLTCVDSFFSRHRCIPYELWDFLRTDDGNRHKCSSVYRVCDRSYEYVQTGIQDIPCITPETTYTSL